MSWIQIVEATTKECKVEAPRLSLSHIVSACNHLKTPQHENLVHEDSPNRYNLRHKHIYHSELSYPLASMVLQLYLYNSLHQISGKRTKNPIWSNNDEKNGAWNDTRETRVRWSSQQEMWRDIELWAMNYRPFHHYTLYRIIISTQTPA